MRAVLGFCGLCILLLTGTAFGAGIDKALAVPGFTGVGSEGSVDVYVTVGAKQSVVVHGEPKDVETVMTRMRDGVLIITQKNTNGYGWTSSNKNLRVDITTPALDRIAVSGSSDIYATGINTKRMHISVAGSGDVKASGRADRAEISVAGSGDVKAGDLHAADTSITIAGSGDVAAYASKSVAVSIAGSGDVTVYGNPPATARTSKVLGSGDVTFK